MKTETNSWTKREPWVVQDPTHKREWLVLQPLQYYLHQRSDGLWTVIDHWLDAPAEGHHTTRTKAIRAFYKQAGRAIPSGRKPPTRPETNHKG